MSTRRIAVVGAGMAAARFAQQVAASGGTDTVVTLFGDEDRAPYNRALLADVLSARLPAAMIDLPVGRTTVLRTGVRITALDPERRTVRIATRDGAIDAGVDVGADAGVDAGVEAGADVDFDAIVLATGAGPVLPPLRNLRAGAELLPGVHAFRTLADCAGLAEAAAGATRCVVIGGGVLGVSAARALATLGPAVEIVHQAEHLMERHLDAEAAAALRRGLAELGVAVYADNRARALTGTDRVTGVELANGHVLDADLVVLACGVRPRVALARAAGLDVATGIVVDDTLATSAPGVYAIGDCAEYAGSVHGSTAAAWDQADVLAARFAGHDVRHTGARALTRLTAGPLEIAAFGDVVARAGDDVVRIADPTRNAYKKLVIRGDRLVAGILIGDLATAGALSRAFERDDPLPASPLDLLAGPVPAGAAR